MQYALNYSGTRFLFTENKNYSICWWIHKDFVPVTHHFRQLFSQRLCLPFKEWIFKKVALKTTASLLWRKWKRRHSWFYLINETWLKAWRCGNILYGVLKGIFFSEHSFLNWQPGGHVWSCEVIGAELFNMICIRNTLRVRQVQAICLDWLTL